MITQIIKIEPGCQPLLYMVIDENMIFKTNLAKVAFDYMNAQSILLKVDPVDIIEKYWRTETLIKNINRSTYYTFACSNDHLFKETSFQQLEKYLHEKGIKVQK